MKRRILCLGLCLACVSGLAHAADWPAPIQRLADQGVTVIKKIDAPEGMTGYAAKAGQRPVALYLTPDGKHVIIGTLPIAILGFTFAPVIETAARNLWLVATVLIVFGIILGLVDRWGSKTKALEALNAKDGLLFGFGQALALIPGVSRSGATISVGLAMGYSRSAATRYAFLLAIPAVLASGLYEATKIGSDDNVQWGQTILATIIALTIGYLVIAWLIRWVSTRSFLPFVIYRVTLGSLLLTLLATGTISAL